MSEGEVALELPVPLEDILKVTEVQVVQQLDVGALQQTLRWIIDQLHSGTGSGAGGLPERISRLEKENEELKEQLKQLEVWFNACHG